MTLNTRRRRRETSETREGLRNKKKIRVNEKKKKKKISNKTFTRSYTRVPDNQVKFTVSRTFNKHTHTDMSTAAGQTGMRIRAHNRILRSRRLLLVKIASVDTGRNSFARRVRPTKI